MPTDDLSNNPFTDALETKEEREARLERDRRIKDLIAKLPTKEQIEALAAHREEKAR